MLNRELCNNLTIDIFSNPTLFNFKMKISIKPLEPDLINDYLNFFDNIAFTENPDWAKCYCYSFHFTGKTEEWRKESNRTAVTSLIKKKEMKGYLAFDGKIPVGWCNVNPRENYPALNKHYDIDLNSNKKVASIVCFLIHPEYRRKGIAHNMLQTIIEDYSMKDYDFLEAYPAKHESSDEQNYKGPIRMYSKLGFEVIKELKNNFLVRKKL